MIDNRPAYLIEDPNYAVIPALPIGLELSTVAVELVLQALQ